MSLGESLGIEDSLFVEQQGVKVDGGVRLEAGSQATGSKYSKTVGIRYLPLVL